MCSCNRNSRTWLHKTVLHYLPMLGLANCILIPYGFYVFTFEPTFSGGCFCHFRQLCWANLCQTLSIACPLFISHTFSRTCMCGQMNIQYITLFSQIADKVNWDSKSSARHSLLHNRLLFLPAPFFNHLVLIKSCAINDGLFLPNELPEQESYRSVLSTVPHTFAYKQVHRKKRTEYILSIFMKIQTFGYTLLFEHVSKNHLSFFIVLYLNSNQVFLHHGITDFTSDSHWVEWMLRRSHRCYTALH